MVQSEKLSSASDGEEPTFVDPVNLAKGVEKGQYKIIGWAADTTGRRLIDEIMQIAAYAPDSQFSQYIMPFSDIRLIYRRRYSIKVMNMGKYRMLKDTRANKFVKTKSEISAMTDFVTWLEQNKGDAKDGIILVFHEFNKSIPAMLLESLRRHNLSERFAAAVKGFANCYHLAHAKCANATKAFSLRTLSKVLLGTEVDISSAVPRAKCCYDIVMNLGQSELNDLDSKGSGDAKLSEECLIQMIAPFTNPVSAEEDEIKEFKVLLDRQNTFKPVFGALLRATPTERQHASHLRRLLAENRLDYEKVQEAFQKSAKDGLTEVLKNEISNAKEEELEELVHILDCYFDPEKKAVQPKPRFFNNNNNHRRYRTRSENSNHNKSGHIKQEPKSPGGSSSDANNSQEPTIDIKEEIPTIQPEPIAAN